MGARLSESPPRTQHLDVAQLLSVECGLNSRGGAGKVHKVPFVDVTSRLSVFPADAYNARCMHSSLGYLLHNQFEDRYAQHAV